MCDPPINPIDEWSFYHDGDLGCRDVVIEKPCIVGAQPAGNYAN